MLSRSGDGLAVKGLLYTNSVESTTDCSICELYQKLETTMNWTFPHNAQNDLT